jgi:hypothetical protein
LLADGQDVVAYRDEGGFNDLYYVRSLPPHSDAVASNEHLELRLNNALDDSRTMVLVSTTPLSGTQWTQIEPGQMIVARRAAIQWISATRAPALVQPPAQSQVQGVGPMDIGSSQPALGPLAPPNAIVAQSAPVIGPAQSNLGQQSQAAVGAERRAVAPASLSSRVMR